MRLIGKIWYFGEVSYNNNNNNETLVQGETPAQNHSSARWTWKQLNNNKNHKAQSQLVSQAANNLHHTHTHKHTPTHNTLRTQLTVLREWRGYSLSVVAGLEQMGLQGSFKCSGLLNVRILFHVVENSRQIRSSIIYEKERFHNVFVLTCGIHTGGAERSWWRVHMKKWRKVNRGCFGKKEWQSVDSLYSIRVWIGSQWRVLRRGKT